MRSLPETPFFGGYTSGPQCGMVFDMERMFWRAASRPFIHYKGKRQEAQ